MVKKAKKIGNLTIFEVMRSFGCRNESIKNRIIKINSTYDSLRRNFDWINFIKHQNNNELMKEILFTKEQNDAISCTMKRFPNDSIDVKYIFYNY